MAVNERDCQDDDREDKREVGPHLEGRGDDRRRHEDPNQHVVDLLPQLRKKARFHRLRDRVKAI